MVDLVWKDHHIEITPPKRPKKITGTRFATILGLNPWSTAFEVWAEITRTYQKPFESTIYTEAGKTIEPKQARYMMEAYGMDNLITPTDVFGEDYFNKTFGDFFKERKILGGMWDYLLYENGEPDTVLEMKTTKRAEDWGNDVPEYYALQAALYAYLLGVDKVIMVASFLSPRDYEHPEDFKPSVANTVTVEFKVSERYPDFADKVARVEEWWRVHVEGGISPDFDEKKDAEILKELRTNNLTPDTDIEAVMKEAEDLKARIDAVSAEIAGDEKRLKTLTEIIKKHAIGQFRDGDNKVALRGTTFLWEVSRSDSLKLDEDAMKADGVYDKYCTRMATAYRITQKRL